MKPTKEKRKRQIGPRLWERRAQKALEKVDTNESIDKYEIIEGYEKKLDLMVKDVKRRSPFRKVSVFDAISKDINKGHSPDDKDVVTCKAISDATARRKCSLAGCEVRRQDSQFFCVPKIPTKPQPRASKEKWLQYYRKHYSRQELCDRMGLSRNDKTVDLRYCACHKTELKSFYPKFTYGENATPSKATIVLQLPIPNGRKSSLNNIVALTPQPSKGIAVDRRVIRELDKASQLQNTTFGYQVMSETHEIYSNPNAATEGFSHSYVVGREHMNYSLDL